MLLSQTGEYALRAMAQLAVLPNGEAVRARDLAQLADIPAHYLSKILRSLVEAKLLRAEKGHHGGFRLARKAGDIRFVDILDAVGARPETNRCVFGVGRCNPKKPCLLHPVVTGLNDAFDDWSQTTTLGHLSPAPEALEKLTRDLAVARRD